ncbi:hypothetical protein CGCSCA5_v013987 [Colletotrichum siamense]|nr:hypothetical protein CGCSCA5_v013987 [Colletotrichum siamense]
MQFSNTIVAAFTLAFATFSAGVNARCGPRNGLCSGELSFRCFDTHRTRLPLQRCLLSISGEDVLCRHE